MSIRRRLVIMMVLLFGGGWAAAAVAAYYSSLHEIEELLDAQLAQTAATIAELFLPDIDRQDSENRQLSRAVYGHRYERRVSFQIWQGERLKLRSQSAPVAQLAAQSGFSDETVDGTRWRVFALDDASGRFRVYAGENYAVRDELVANVLSGALLPPLLALILLSGFIWVAIGQGLKPLRQVARQVAERNPQQLAPIAKERAPREIAPLIESLNALLQRLQAAFDKERRFTADASHELRTPLASIKIQAQVARRATDTATRQQALERIIQGVDRSTHLVEQMLTLARLEPEAIADHMHEVDLAELARTVLADLTPLALSRSVDLDLAVQCQQGVCRVRGYAPGLAVMLRNLVDNATRYSPLGGQVVVVLGCADSGCCLTVTDNGPGIPPVERQRVLERFYRRTGHDSYGCGLGLAIVQRIVELHRAELHLADAASGTGLKVTVRLACSEK